jgi:hypothetical protein
VLLTESLQWKSRGIKGLWICRINQVNKIPSEISERRAPEAQFFCTLLNFYVHFLDLPKIAWYTGSFKKRIDKDDGFQRSTSHNEVP